jgi:HPt (histidine-containing phosphotransfer) domain-containing protein
MNDYIAKPVTPAALAQIIHKWLPKFEGSAPLDDTDQSKQTTQASVQHLPAAGPRIDTKLAFFDEKTLLARLEGDRALARILLSTFLADLPKQIESLANYVQSEDAPGAERQAHTIKGAAAAVGGDALVSLALKLELAGKAGDLPTICAALEELRSQFENLKNAMESSLLCSPEAPEVSHEGSL